MLAGSDESTATPLRAAIAALGPLNGENVPMNVTSSVVFATGFTAVGSAVAALPSQATLSGITCGAGGIAAAC
jgi:hypothetical protein